MSLIVIKKASKQLADKAHFVFRKLLRYERF